MAMVDGALCVSLGLEPQPIAEPIKADVQIKNKSFSEKQDFQSSVDLWKGLYYGLLDKLIQAKGA